MPLRLRSLTIGQMMKWIAHAAAACGILVLLVPIIRFTPFWWFNLLIILGLVMPVVIIWIPTTWILERDWERCILRTYCLLFLLCINVMILISVLTWIVLEEGVRSGRLTFVTSHRFFILLAVWLCVVMGAILPGIRLWRVHRARPRPPRSF